MLHVRRAVEFINGDYPFSPSFGSATTREECAKASQNLFDKLLKKDEHVLTFDVLGKIARHLDGTNDRKKIMELVKLFRPNRKGEITKLDFVKSIDRYVNKTTKFENCNQYAIFLIRSIFVIQCV